ncbi:MAG TPA: SurA N-terminal domain-containing protein [Beijerinckiaceae bacterium]|nr:SurA N-terminal domain-containing protein [Beijerinckiaceae bacterium]
MLDAMRKASEGWIGRIIMGVVMTFIIFSFAIWGIGDIFHGFGGDNLAKVGGSEITTEQFRSAYLRQLNRLQQQLKRPITSQEAHAMGLESQVLAKLVDDTVLDNEANRLGLAMSDKAVARTIVQDPAFKGANGKFDANVFASVLQNNGLTQAMLVREQRALYLRREVADAVAGHIPAPRLLLQAVHRYREETRSIDYIALTAASAGVVAAPTKKQLQTYFDARRASYRAPEYRKLVVLALTPQSLADQSSISDAQARAVYDKNKSAYGSPEMRHVLQATFPTSKAAAQALASIHAGTGFKAAAQKAKASMVDLGQVSQSQIFNPAIAKAAFSVPQGGVSAPVKGQFGWVLVKAVTVTAATTKPFASVEASIKKGLAMQQAEGKISSLRDRIEDQRTSGKTLTQVAQALGLKITDVQATDAEGLDDKGERIANLPDRQALLKAAFASDVGMDNDYLSTRDGGYVWFEVAKVTPARQRTLAEVQPQVEKAWRRDQISQRLAAKAKDLVEKLRGGAKLAALAKSENLPVQNANDVKRIGTTQVPAAVVAQVFAVPVGGAGSAAPGTESRIVFKVEDSVTPPFDPASKTNVAISAELKQQLTEDVLTEYLAQLQSAQGVSVNPAAVASAITGAQ